MAQPNGDGEANPESERTTDEREWPSEEERAEAPPALATVRAFMILDGTCYIEEEGEGIAHGQLIGAREWYGPDPRYNPDPDAGDDEGGYAVTTPSGEVRVRAQDVADIRTIDDLQSGGE